MTPFKDADKKYPGISKYVAEAITKHLASKKGKLPFKLNNLQSIVEAYRLHNNKKKK